MKLSHAFAVATALAAVTSPAIARRTAIDPNGTRVAEGYCDANGDQCNDESTLPAPYLPYAVTFGSSPASNKIYITGNGILTFGSPVDFASRYSIANGVLSSRDNLDFADSYIFGRIDSRVSSDQIGVVDFNQSGQLSYDALTDTITARWYYNGPFDSPDDANPDPFVLSLHRTEAGFIATVVGTGQAGYTIGDAVMSEGSPFLIPATFSPLAAVPEPASWAMVIGGIGFAGGALRRNRRVTVSKVAFA